MSLIDDLLHQGCDLGAEFVEVFREETRKALFGYKDQKVESVSAGTDFGYGVRMIRGDQVLYIESSLEDVDHLCGLMKNVVKTYGWEGKLARVEAQDPLNFYNRHAVKLFPAQEGQQRKVKWCQEADQIARAASSKIQQVSVQASDETQEVLIANNEGVWVEDQRIRCRLSVSATAGDGQELATGSESPGALRGMEFFEELDIPSLAKQASTRALRMLSAGYIQGGKMPVVIGPGFGGVIFHEAYGHPLETESVRKNASPFCGKIGEPIAHEAVTAIDDGTNPGVWGSLSVDDEGMETQRTTLIENGVLKTFLSDRIGSQQVGVERSASARRQNFRYAPVARMRNTYIEAGQDSLDDMLQSVENGLYAKVMGGGSVNPATGEFNFSVQEGYKIKNGKISEPVRGATLIGKGHEIMPKISMVGKDKALAAGMCGASSGHVPVTVGQPTIKVDEILVGGR